MCVHFFTIAEYCYMSGRGMVLSLMGSYYYTPFNIFICIHGILVNSDLIYQHLCETEPLYYLFGSSCKRIMPLCHLVDDILVLTLNAVGINWFPFTYILANLITNSIHAWLTRNYRWSGMISRNVRSELDFFFYFSHLESDKRCVFSFRIFVIYFEFSHFGSDKRWVFSFRSYKKC